MGFTKAGIAMADLTPEQRLDIRRKTYNWCSQFRDAVQQKAEEHSAERAGPSTREERNHDWSLAEKKVLSKLESKILYSGPDAWLSRRKAALRKAKYTIKPSVGNLPPLEGTKALGPAIIVADENRLEDTPSLEDFVRRTEERHIPPPLIVLSRDPTRERMQHFLDHRASFYLPADTDDEVMLDILNKSFLRSIYNAELDAFTYLARSNKRLLYVLSRDDEDNPIVRGDLTQYTSTSFSTEMAFNPRDALSRLGSGHFAGTIIDFADYLERPDEVFRLIEEIRQRGSGPDIAVLYPHTISTELISGLMTTRPDHAVSDDPDSFEAGFKEALQSMVVNAERREEKIIARLQPSIRELSAIYGELQQQVMEKVLSDATKQHKSSAKREKLKQLDDLLAGIKGLSDIEKQSEDLKQMLGGDVAFYILQGDKLFENGVHELPRHHLAYSALLSGNLISSQGVDSQGEPTARSDANSILMRFYTNCNVPAGVVALTGAQQFSEEQTEEQREQRELFRRMATKLHRLKKHKVLLMDDEPLKSDQYKVRFEGAGFDYVYASNGRDALARFQEEDFDAIVSGLPLPHKGGLDILEEVRSHDQNIPFFLLSDSELEEEQKQRASALGCTGFLMEEDLMPNPLNESVKDIADAITSLYNEPPSETTLEEEGVRAPEDPLRTQFPDVSTQPRKKRDTGRLRSQGASYRIFLVEGNPDLAKELSGLLTAKGFEVIRKSNNEEVRSARAEDKKKYGSHERFNINQVPNQVKQEFIKALSENPENFSEKDVYFALKWLSVNRDTNVTSMLHMVQERKAYLEEQLFMHADVACQDLEDLSVSIPKEMFDRFLADGGSLAQKVRTKNALYYYMNRGWSMALDSYDKLMGTTFDRTFFAELFQAGGEVRISFRVPDETYKKAVLQSALFEHHKGLLSANEARRIRELLQDYIELEAPDQKEFLLGGLKSKSVTTLNKFMDDYFSTNIFLDDLILIIGASRAVEIRERLTESIKDILHAPGGEGSTGPPHRPGYGFTYSYDLPDPSRNRLFKIVHSFPGINVNLESVVKVFDKRRDSYAGQSDKAYKQDVEAKEAEFKKEIETMDYFARWKSVLSVPFFVEDTRDLDVITMSYMGSENLFDTMLRLNLQAENFKSEEYRQKAQDKKKKLLQALMKSMARVHAFGSTKNHEDKGENFLSRLEQEVIGNFGRGGEGGNGFSRFFEMLGNEDATNAFTEDVKPNLTAAFKYLTDYLETLGPGAFYKDDILRNHIYMHSGNQAQIVPIDFGAIRKLPLQFDLVNPFIIGRGIATLAEQRTHAREFLRHYDRQVNRYNEAIQRKLKRKNLANVLAEEFSREELCRRIIREYLPQMQDFFQRDFEYTGPDLIENKVVNQDSINKLFKYLQDKLIDPLKKKISRSQLRKEDKEDRKEAMKQYVDNVKRFLGSFEYKKPYISGNKSRQRGQFAEFWEGYLASAAYKGLIAAKSFVGYVDRNMGYENLDLIISMLDNSVIALNGDGTAKGFIEMYGQKVSSGSPRYTAEGLEGLKNLARYVQEMRDLAQKYGYEHTDRIPYLNKPNEKLEGVVRNAS